MDGFTSSFPQEIKHAETIQHVLHQRARLTPDADAVSFLTYPNGEEQLETLSYAGLDRRAGAIAETLLSQAAPGDRILLAHEPGLAFIESFFGCLYAGMIAVPLAPPHSRDRSRINNIALDAGAQLMLMQPEQIARWQAAGHSSLTCLSNDTLLSPEGYAFHQQKDAGNTLAFLQYTSGTTGNPKGVMVRQTELLTNLNQIRNACNLDASSIALNWLPLYHDMGLIGTLLTPIFTGFPTLLMSPLTFVKCPFYWLQAISHHRATICGGPGFAYQHCLDLIPEEQHDSFDLTSWRIAFCGAEMIHAQTLENFARAFTPSGFCPDSFYPCYGMAEATLFITGSHPDNGALIENFDAAELEQGRVKPGKEGKSIPVRRLVGCGYPFPDTDLRIVGPSGEEKAPDEVGEIWANGPGLAIGYWNKKELSQHTFSATLTGTTDKTFLRTGDLGFFYKDQIFICGRAKDLIILDGRNIAPQDLEWVAKESHPDVVQAAAFSIFKDDREQVVMLVEIERRCDSDLDSISRTIRRATSRTLGIPLHAMALVRTKLLPRTTSGKLSRSRCRQDYSQNRLSLLHHWQTGKTTMTSPSGPLPQTSWLLRPQIHPDPALRLYCFSYGGGGASTFLSWRTSLDNRIEICPVQLPGRENRLKEEPIRRPDPLYRFFEELAAREDNTPFAFCGYSMGGHLAFALARHLRKKGLPGPECLLLSAIREPALMPVEPAHRFSDEGLLAYAKQFGEIPSQIKDRPDALKNMLSLFRADMELSETLIFTDEPPLDCPISLFGGIDDPTVKIEHLLPWRKHTSSTFSVHLLAGSHMFLDQQREEYLRLITCQLAPFVEKKSSDEHNTSPLISPMLSVAPSVVDNNEVKN